MAAPLLGMVQRFYFPMLVLLAIALMMVGHVNLLAVDQARSRVTDAVSPVLNVLSRPAASVADGLEYFRQMIDMHGENERLRGENARLLQWQQAALRLEAEKSLAAVTALLQGRSGGACRQRARGRGPRRRLCPHGCGHGGCP